MNCAICKKPIQRGYFCDNTICHTTFENKVNKGAREMGFKSMNQVEDLLGSNVVYDLLKAIMKCNK